MRLVLVGGGHAHVEVLRSLAARPLPPPGAALTLITPRPGTSPYSGMLPGVLEGLYARGQAEIDVAALARAVPGASVVLGRAAAVDTEKREVFVVEEVMEGGRTTSSTISYDVLSLDVGAGPGWGGVPGAAEWTTPIKPIDALLDRVGAVVAQCEAASSSRAAPSHPAITVVGGGPAGAELAAALAVRLSGSSETCAGGVALVCGGRLLPNLPTKAAAAVKSRLAGLGVRLLEKERVVRVGKGGVLTLGTTGAPTTTTTLQSDACLWCTGATAPAWLGDGPSPPPLDAAGFVAVGASLACSDDPSSPLSRVFAVGDCASIGPHPRPKAGVFAVRQGPPLDAALRAAVSGAPPPPPFTPQAAATALLSTGRRTAVGVVPLFGSRSLPPLVVSGRWVWRVKDAIDRRFVARYRV